MRGMTVNEIHASDAGVWLDGAMGWRNTYRVIRIAEGHGFEAIPELEDVISRLERYGQDDVTTEEWWDAVSLSDDATDHLNSLAPEGFWFEWDMGELRLVNEGERS